LDFKDYGVQETNKSHIRWDRAFSPHPLDGGILRAGFAPNLEFDSKIGASWHKQSDGWRSRNVSFAESAS
jgi:hypothetical protein